VPDLSPVPNPYPSRPPAPANRSPPHATHADTRACWPDPSPCFRQHPPAPVAPLRPVTPRSSESRLTRTDPDLDRITGPDDVAPATHVRNSAPCPTFRPSRPPAHARQSPPRAAHADTRKPSGPTQDPADDITRPRTGRIAAACHAPRSSESRSTRTVPYFDRITGPDDLAPATRVRKLAPVPDLSPVPNASPSRPPAHARQSPPRAAHADTRAFWPDPSPCRRHHPTPAPVASLRPVTHPVQANPD